MSSAGLAPLLPELRCDTWQISGLTGAPANQVQCRMCSVTSVIFSLLTWRYIVLIPAELRVALDATALEVTSHATSSHELHVEASEME